VHNLFHKTSCAPNLCIRKIVKRSKLEKKQKERKPPVGARVDGAARGRSKRATTTACHIGFAPFRVLGLGRKPTCGLPQTLRN
jgi:hypothetical protein